jgi:hypothetical protein
VHRRFSRIQIILAVIIVLWIADVALLSIVRRNPGPWPPQELLPMYSAYANQGCTEKGDWKFEVSIIITQQDVIIISVSEQPGFESPVTFSFPDGITHKHVAVLAGMGMTQEKLDGKVEFSQAVMAIPFAGRFNLRTAGGKQFIGKFNAEWGDLVINCEFMK